MSEQKKSPAAKALPQCNPLGGYLAHKAEIDEAINKALNSGQYILGSEVSSFEKEFADFIGSSYCVGTGSGTEALHLAIKALGIGPGDAVITVSHTAVATVAAIELAGAVPVLVDVNPAYYTMDPASLERTIKEYSGKLKLKAVLPVHLYGQMASVKEICDIAASAGLAVIEDCAQAHGASFQGRKAGSWGDIAAFSFYPTKNLGAMGDGGCVVTKDAAFAEKALLLRQYGWKERYVSELAGMNTRLDEVQAAILRVKLKYLAGENEKRNKIAEVYSRSLQNTSVVFPETRCDTVHVYHQYVVRCFRRDEFKEDLKRKNIGTAIHYPVPIHLQPAYKGRIRIAPDGLRNTEELCRNILSLPMFPEMRDDEVESVCDAIRSFKE